MANRLRCTQRRIRRWNACCRRGLAGSSRACVGQKGNTCSGEFMGLRLQWAHGRGRVGVGCFVRNGGRREGTPTSRARRAPRSPWGGEPCGRRGAGPSRAATDSAPQGRGQGGSASRRHTRDRGEVFQPSSGLQPLKDGRRSAVVTSKLKSPTALGAPVEPARRTPVRLPFVRAGRRPACRAGASNPVRPARPPVVWDRFHGRPAVGATWLQAARCDRLGRRPRPQPPAWLRGKPYNPCSSSSGDGNA